jgi:MYXO-CTERM domain-containing protein
MRFSLRAATLALTVLASGCALDVQPEPLGTARSSLTVDQEIAKATCSTSSAVVGGLSQQILDEIASCLNPGVLVKVPSDAKLAIDAVHPYLVKPAYDALKKAAAGRTDALNVSSMFRSVAQQYFLYRRSDCYPAVAAPGTSNHETGIAIDVSDPDNSSWRSVLTANGFKWLGDFDRFHFDYTGPGSVNLRGQDVLAFQRLWNRNNPSDKIAEDGDWGPQTEARMKKSPAGGFAIGADCGPPPVTTKPWPNLSVEAAAEGEDRFGDGASTAVVDVLEGDEYAVLLVVKNAGDDVAKDVSLGVWLEEPYVSALRWDIESDKGSKGTFAPSDANARADNPPHDAPGAAFTLKIGSVSPDETKRVRLKAKAAKYSIGAVDAPDVRVWVKDVPGVYTKAEFGAKADNVGARQTSNGGDLKASAPVDVYSRVRWSFDGGVLEGWTATNATASAEDEAKGLVLSAAGALPAQATSPTTSFAARDWPTLLLKTSGNAAGKAKVSFATAEAPTFGPTRALEIDLAAAAQGIAVRMADHPAWRGTVTQLRIELPSTPTLALDDVRMSASAATGADAPPADEQARGCGCRAGRRADAGPALWALLALAALRPRRR